LFTTQSIELQIQQQFNRTIRYHQLNASLLRRALALPHWVLVNVSHSCCSTLHEDPTFEEFAIELEYRDRDLNHDSATHRRYPEIWVFILQRSGSGRLQLEFVRI
jgi:hypothetical protein